jgi:hypothetical protein
MKPAFGLLLLGLLLSTGGAAAQDLSQLSEQELEARAVALFQRSCTQAGCHTGPIPQQGMDLTADQFYASLVGVPSQERPELMRVNPGDPASSYLIHKVKGAPGIMGLPMPMTGDRLSEQEVATLEAWIRRIEAVDEGRREATPTAAPFAFAGWQVVNLPTTRMHPRGTTLFRISHRFNPAVSDGYEAFYGLDGSGIILLSLGYAFTDDFSMALGRSNVDDTVELQGRYRFARQSAQGGFPVSLAAQATVDWVTEKQNDLGRLDHNLFKVTGQLIATRELAEGIGVTVAPGLLLNPALEEEDESLLLTVGLGGRWRFYGRCSLLLEWVPIVSGYTRTSTFGNDNRFDSWGGGLEIATAGHVFQIVVSNSVGLAADQYLRGGDLDIRDADFRLGFNIYRVLNF